MKQFIIISSLFALASAANAQNRNAFKQMDSILGVTVTRAATQQGTSFTVSVAANATIVRSGKSHKLEAIDGFWLLSNKGDLGAVQVALNNYDNHSNNSGGSSAYGFQTQLKNGIGAGQSATFTFSTIGNPATLDHFGFKVKATGVPAHIYGGNDACAVPEPASFAVIGLGLVAIRKRRAKKSA